MSAGWWEEEESVRKNDPERWETLKRRVRSRLEDYRQIEDEELFELIDEEIAGMGKEEFFPLSERLRARERLFDSFRRLGILQEMMDRKDITEIMVNGKDQIFVEKNGSLTRWEGSFESEEQLEDTIQQIVSRVNRVVNVSEPIADARLPDGSRVHVVLPPVALDGPALTIRKFPEPITMSRLVELEAVTEEAAQFLGTLVRAGYNIFISGGTGSGKTTFLNALSSYIPPDERIVTIEDSAELQIRQIPNLVRLETRNDNGEGNRPISVGDLIRAALRMRPDRIIVGEVRGEEAFSMLSAFNTGHDGSLCTGHGNSTADMLARLETMVLMGADLPLEAIRSQIASAVDVMVHLGRMRDKSRKVLEIVEIGGCENGKVVLNPLFRFQEKEGAGTGKVEGCLQKAGELKNRLKLAAAGCEL
ncbi:MAG TPA: CpaF family protein [Candidatus Lachnoclostridium pullistercoris]|uniref:CpaF family protein n=1 Tax=Candidatus Lachnoclostridium pullistercoris TaxID=2838632 RepID=A0A9D2PDC4_9FIRM|nr:CpaF family protein [Candidatus Lachnoclostridium pullistercoris]